VLDAKISHRFGFISGGAYELWGLDESMIRIGADYGITDQLTVGLGRSSFQKTYDGFVKYKLLRQSTGLKNMPVTVAFLFSEAIQTEHWKDTSRENYFSSRLYHTFQLIIGRKFSNEFSFQVSPTLVHRNLVETAAEENDVFALVSPAASNSISVLPSMVNGSMYPKVNSIQGITTLFPLVWTIETGGHVFQLHFTNSTS
jgi:hypothetical protein